MDDVVTQVNILPDLQLQNLFEYLAPYLTRYGWLLLILGLLNEVPDAPNRFTSWKQQSDYSSVLTYLRDDNSENNQEIVANDNESSISSEENDNNDNTNANDDGNSAAEMDE